MAFAITGGTFNTPSIWDTGVVPTGSENAYANGFTIQVSGTVNCNSVRNDASDYYLVNTAIPLMTSNTTPSGNVIVSGQGVGAEGWRAFDRSNSTFWQCNTVNIGWLGYIFPTGKTIKRYSIFTTSGSGVHPRTWTFEGSNDGSSWTVLDTQTLVTLSNATFYTYPITNTTSYTYYRINITATINPGANPALAEFEMTESTSSVIGKVVGGTFNLTSGSTLTCTASTGVIVGSTTAPITFALPFGSSATVNATIPSVTTVVNYAAVLLNGLGTLNFNGDISCGPTSTTNMRVINITAAGTLNYNGVCTNGGNNTNQCNSIFSSAAANINIITTGFAGGNTLTPANSSIFMNAGGTLFITSSGNISAGVSPAITIVGGVSLTIVGSVVGGSIEAIRNVTTAIANTTVTGSITAGNAANAIVALGGVRVVGPLVNTNQFMAVYAPKMLIDSTTSWQFQQLSGPDITLYAPGANVGNPSASDVRFGVSFGLGSFTGTAYIPTPSTVLLGTQVDATTGTLLMTPAQFVSELNTSTTPVAVRLQNCATVSSTGDQVASYGV